MKKLFFPALCLVILTGAPVVRGQEADTETPPAWLLIEQGKAAYEMRDFGLAFRLFREALDRTQPLPEAHMWLAVLYEEEGEYELAERHYLEALSDERDLYILEDAQLIRYRLSALYEISRQYGKYESMLREITDSDELTIEKIALRNAMIRNLKEAGIDKVLELYRLDIPMYRRAYADLGVFYYKTGRYGESVENLTLAVLDIFSSCIEDVMEHDPSFAYKGVRPFLQMCMEDEKIVGFLERSDFFEYFYYLGCALYAEGELLHAGEIWQLVTSYAPDGQWRRKASEQLRRPYIEPIISISE